MSDSFAKEKADRLIADFERGVRFIWEKRHQKTVRRIVVDGVGAYVVEGTSDEQAREEIKRLREGEVR